MSDQEFHSAILHRIDHVLYGVIELAREAVALAREAVFKVPNPTPAGGMSAEETATLTARIVAAEQKLAGVAAPPAP